MILPDPTTAAVLSDLSQGRSVETVASKHHLDVGVVEQIRDLYGPDRAHLTAASRALYKKIRTAPSEEPENDAKRYQDAGPRLEQTAIKVPAELEDAPEPEEAPAVDDEQDTAQCPDCGPLPCPHHPADATDTAPDVAAVWFECARCEEEVAPGAPIGTWKANGEPICATCYRDQDDPLPTPTSAPLVVVVNNATGDAHTVASEVGQALLESGMGVATTVPDAVDQPGGVDGQVSLDGSGDTAPEEPPASSAPAESIERLLSEARLLDGPPRVLARAITEQLDRLHQLVSEWRTSTTQRLLDELDQISVRQAAILEELQRIAPRTVATPVPAPPDRSVWMALTTEVRKRIRAFSAELGRPSAGRIGAATVEEYLAIHPEDDPR